MGIPFALIVGRLGRLVAVLAVTAAAGAAPAWASGPVAWGAPSTTGLKFVSLSCPSAQMCVGVDSSGNVDTSGDPMGGPSAWQATPIHAADGSTVAAYRVSCASPTLCVATDLAGDVITSTDPTGGASAWHLATIDSGGDPSRGVLMTGVSCPSAQLCVAVDSTGNALVSTDPTGGSSAWRTFHIDGGTTYECSHYGETGPQCQPGLLAVACPSSAECVATDDATTVFTSTDPADGAWSESTSGSGVTSDAYAYLACASVTLCVANMYYGNQVFSFDPTGSRSPTSPTIDPNGSLTGVWCSTANLCFSADGGQLYASDDPPGSAWPASYTAATAIGSMACLSPTVCLLADDGGHLVEGWAATAVRADQAQLARELRRALRGLTIPRLLAHGTTLTVRPPAPGHVFVAWIQVKPERLIASARATFAGTRTRRVRLRLSRTGRRVLRRARSIRVRATAGFIPQDGPEIRVNLVIRLGSLQGR
jgi:hypothetical protein